MKPLIQCRSGSTPETSWNEYGTNQGTNEDESQSDVQPEAGLLWSQRTRNFGPEDGHDMVTGIHEDATHRSSNTSPGKQKTNHSASQAQIDSRNTLAVIAADQIL